MALSEAEELEMLELEKEQHDHEQAQGGGQFFGMTEEPVVPEEPVGTPSMGESFGRGAGQGITLGFQDEASALTEQGISKLAGMLGLQDKATEDLYNSKTYSDLRDTYRGQNQAAQEANPNTYLGGELTGAVASGFLPGGAAAKGAGTLARVGQAATMGGLQSAGYSKADLTKGEVGDFSKDVGMGAALGGGIQGATSLVGSGIRKGMETYTPKIANYLKGVSEEAAVGALAPGKRERLALRKSGQLEKLGRGMLDEGYMSAGSTIDDVVEKAETGFSKANDNMKSFLNGVDSFVDDLHVSHPEEAPAFMASPDEFVRNVREGFLNDLQQKGGTQREAKAVLQYLNDEVSSVYNGDKIPFKDLYDLRVRLDKEVNWLKASADPKAEAFKDLRRNLDGYLEGKLDGVLTTFGDEAEKGTYQKLKDKLFVTGKARSLGRNRQAQLDDNRFFSITDYMAGGAVGTGLGIGRGDTAEGIGYGVGGAFANRLLRRRGNIVAATALDKISKALQSQPQALGRFAGVLSEAAKRGNTNLAATHYVLQQTDPEYRQKSEQIFNYEDSEDEMDFGGGQ